MVNDKVIIIKRKKRISDIDINYNYISKMT